MRCYVALLIISSLCLGCGKSAPPNAAPAGGSAPPQVGIPSTPSTPGDVVATVLGQPINRSDCLSKSQGIGSVDVGIHRLVLGLLMDEFSQSQELSLTQQEIDSFWSTLRASAARANPDPTKPLPEPAFDEAKIQTRLKQVQEQLAAADVSRLEKLTLQGQERMLQKALELKSPAAILAYENLLPMRIEAALYKKYGGKVVARQISMQAAGAYFKLAEEAQANGKLKFHDEALKQIFWKHLQDDLAHPEIPPERIDFSLPAWMQIAATMPAKISPTAAPSPVAVTNSASATDPGMLAKFSGVWRTTIERKPSKWQPEGGKFIVLENTQSVLKGRYLLGREHSQPDGKKALWLMTYDAERNAYPFWMFDSAGLLGGRWELTWDPTSNTATGRATDTPAAWTSHGTNRFPEANTNIVNYWMKDETGTLLMEAHAEKNRQSDEAGSAILADWSRSVPASDLPAELKIFDPLNGTWDAVTVSRPAVWTPKEVRLTSVVTREWVLNNRFVLDRSQQADGQESLALFGFDPQSREYRTWWFHSEGGRDTSRGTWDAATETFSFRTEPEQGRESYSTMRVITPNQHEWQIKVTDAAGKVYYDSTITVTRRQ